MFQSRSSKPFQLYSPEFTFPANMSNRCSSGTSLGPFWATCNTQPLPVAPSMPMTWAIAPSSLLSAPTSSAPLSTVAFRIMPVSPPAAGAPVWCPALARYPAIAKEAPHSSTPARRLTLDHWALGLRASNHGQRISLPLLLRQWVHTYRFPKVGKSMASLYF